MAKERNIAIDILKFFAAVFITNSHMELLYGDYGALATGGAIGDALFFFASGFTLFLGRMGRFDNWYKRRIARIYPTVFAWAIVAAFVFGADNGMKDVILRGGGWFVSCIMIYYVVLWIIRRLMENRLWVAFGVVAAVVVVCYFLIDRPVGWSMYGNTYFKWVHFFLFMLLGAILGTWPKERVRGRFWADLVMFVLCTGVYYLILFAGTRNRLMWELQIVSLVPLLGAVYYFFRFCGSEVMRRVYENRYSGWVVRFVGGLCLEIYLVQAALFTDAMNGIFPLNILIMFVIIVAVAYVVRCGARVFSQTFKDGEYDWREVVRPF